MNVLQSWCVCVCVYILGQQSINGKLQTWEDFKGGL